MKILKRIFSLILLTVLVSSEIIMAQEKTNSSGTNKTAREILTAEQKAALKLNREKQIEFRNEFRQTLSGNQLDMLTNPRLTREARIKSFRESLSDNQVNLLKSNRKQIRVQNYNLRTTLTDQQRLRIRRMAIARAQQNRAIFFRARLRNRLNRI